MDVHSYTRKLPHFQPTGETLFVTFRVAGSLPKEVVLRWKEERESAVAQLDKATGTTEATRQQAIYHEQKRAFARFDALLDKATPTHHRLDQPVIADAIAGTLHWHHQQRNLDLLCYCIMPNHVHLVAVPLRPELPLHQIIKSVKTYSAKQVNAHLGRTGRFWQREYYDHVVRNEKELRNIIAYVLENPVKAGLCETWEQWPYSYLAEL